MCAVENWIRHNCSRKACRELDSVSTAICVDFASSPVNFWRAVGVAIQTGGDNVANCISGIINGNRRKLWLGFQSWHDRKTKTVTGNRGGFRCQGRRPGHGLIPLGICPGHVGWLIKDRNIYDKVTQIINVNFQELWASLGNFQQLLGLLAGSCALKEIKKGNTDLHRDISTPYHLNSDYK